MSKKQEDRAMADLQKQGKRESLSTFVSVGDYYDPWKFRPERCLDPNRKNARQPGMISNERRGLI